MPRDLEGWQKVATMGMDLHGDEAGTVVQIASSTSASIQIVYVFTCFYRRLNCFMY